MAHPVQILLCVCLQERERQLQAELIKKQYLGGDKQKKKMIKPSEKFKFNFDWEAQDDTSQDANPLYKMTHEASLLFGRGMRAGMDRREQMKVGLTAVSCANSCRAKVTGVKLSCQQGIVWCWSPPGLLFCIDRQERSSGRVGQVHEPRVKVLCLVRMQCCQALALCVGALRCAWTADHLTAGQDALPGAYAVLQGFIRPL